MLGTYTVFNRQIGLYKSRQMIAALEHRTIHRPVALAVLVILQADFFRRTGDFDTVDDDAVTEFVLSKI
jgi:hypothetical protein